MPRRYDADQTRQELLVTAFELFRTQGFHATSIADLLERLAVTRGALYHHFPNKKALCRAVITGPVADAVSKAWADPIERAASTRQGVAACFEHLLTEANEGEVINGCPLNNLAQELAGQDPDLTVAIGGVFESWCDAVARSLIRDIKAQRIQASIGVEETAGFVVAAIEGALSLAKAQQDLTPIRRGGAELDRYLAAIELGPGLVPV